MHEKSEFDADKDKTKFRQYEDASDRVKNFYSTKYGIYTPGCWLWAGQCHTELGSRRVPVSYCQGSEYPTAGGVGHDPVS